MRRQRAWKAQPNMYGLSVSGTGKGVVVELAIFATPPTGQQRRIEFTCDPARARAIAAALLKRADECERKNAGLLEARA